MNLKEHFIKVNEMAKTIYKVCYGNKVPENFLREYWDYENGIIGNVETAKCYIAAKTIHGDWTESEMEDMEDEWIENGMLHYFQKK